MSNECRPRVVLFDFDGTIINTMEEYAALAAEIVSRRTGLDRGLVLSLYKRTAGMSFRDQLRRMGVSDDLVEAIALEFEEAKKSLLRSISPSPLVYDRLYELRRHGLLIVLSTNNECNVIRDIKWLNELFDIILCYDLQRSLWKGEPHLKELTKKGFKKCEIVFVGDSDYDLDVYGRLGVRSFRTMGLWREEDIVVEEIKKFIIF